MLLCLMGVNRRSIVVCSYHTSMRQTAQPAALRGEATQHGLYNVSICRKEALVGRR